MVNLHIRLLEARDIQPIAAAFRILGWNKPAAQYERYLAEQEEKQRTVHVAFLDDGFVGYVTVQWQSDYPPFREAAIPEIQDFNVLPEFRRRRIGTRLMDAAERIVAEHSPIVGIGVGMDADYGAAQRLYVLRGYVPDGRGLFAHGQRVKYGMQVSIDDDLVLYFTKHLNQSDRDQA